MARWALHLLANRFRIMSTSSQNPLSNRRSSWILANANYLNQISVIFPVFPTFCCCWLTLFFCIFTKYLNEEIINVLEYLGYGPESFEGLTKWSPCRRCTQFATVRRKSSCCIQQDSIDEIGLAQMRTEDSTTLEHFAGLVFTFSRNSTKFWSTQALDFNDWKMTV